MRESKDEAAIGPRAAERLARGKRAAADEPFDRRPIENVYRARAAALARPVQAAARDSEVIHAAVFRLGNDSFAAPLSKIERVIPDPVRAPLPDAAGGWACVTAVDGEILPVLELWRVLGLSENGSPADPHLLKLRSVRPACGLLVGKVLEIRGFEASELLAADGKIRFAKALAPGNVVVLDIESLLAQEVLK